MPKYGKYETYALVAVKGELLEIISTVLSEEGVRVVGLAADTPYRLDRALSALRETIMTSWDVREKEFVSYIELGGSE